MELLTKSIEENSPITLPKIELVKKKTEKKVYYRIKRMMDISGALLGLILFAPLFLIVGIAIKIEDIITNSHGPIIFKRKMVGKDGQLFTFYKFRSMHKNADMERNGLLHMNEVPGPVFKIKNDPRMTLVGKFIRKTSIDELPQLFNVLRGDMSLVGPRPIRPDELNREDYMPRWRKRLEVKPGLTCFWQISGRTQRLIEKGYEDWVNLDIEYINKQSIWLDIKILLKTIPAVISCKGAY
jgi:lipopolysaccharide/colanic/teichoic acid biosynthesis glycosyltransferase